MRRTLVLLVASALVAGAGALVWWRSSGGPAFEVALGLAPAGSERVSWTDWAAVRRELGSDASDASSAQEVEALMAAAFERDLSPASALGESAVALHARYGLSPASLEWEMFAQSPDGALEVLKVGDSFDFDGLAERLTGLGYAEPGSADGVWEGGGDLLARIDPTLTPELQFFALDEDDGIVRTSDAAAYLEAAGDDLGVDALDDVVEASGAPLAASVYTGDHACSRLAMSQADDTDRAEAEALVAEAGEVSPLTAFAMSAQLDGDVRVAMSFETDEQARGDVATRARLAGGPAPGQGGDFTDRFEVASAEATGRVAVLDLAPVEGAYVLSDLSSGPVLFATC